MKQELKNRLLSLAWRAGAAAVVAILAVVTNALPELKELGLPEFIAMVLALAAGEVTKTLNKKYQLGDLMLGRKK